MEDLTFCTASALCSRPASPNLLISVIVPAKNEEENIWQTLHALFHQTYPDGSRLSPTSYEIIVLANNCHDQTAVLARRFGNRNPDFNLHVAEMTLPPAQAHIGYVRRILMDEAYQRLTNINKPRGIIASTDGDTMVDTHWVYHIIQSIAKGADAVGGRILTQPEQSFDRLYHLQDVTYRYLIARLEDLLDYNMHDPWPRHFQHFGPSLAVTCTMYDRVGRLPVLASLEDVAFYEALQRFDSKVRHSPEAKVYTSTRKTGRVDFGFSVQLQQWQAMRKEGKPMMVPGLEACMYTITLRRRLRACWRHLSQNLDEVYVLSTELGLTAHDLIDCVTSTLYFGALYHDLMHMPVVQTTVAQKFPLIPITQAISELRAYINGTEKLFSQKGPAGRRTFHELPADALSA